MQIKTGKAIKKRKIQDICIT